MNIATHIMHINARITSLSNGIDRKRTDISADWIANSREKGTMKAPTKAYLHAIYAYLFHLCRRYMYNLPCCRLI